MRVKTARVLLLALLWPGTSALGGSIQKIVDESGRVFFTNLGTDRSGLSGSRATSSLLQAVRKPEMDREQLYLPLIEEAAARYSISPDLVKAIIKVESNFDPNAVSVKGCKGLMQLHSDTAKRFGVKDVFDPGQNIEGGVKYMRFLLDYFQNDLSLALAGYNAGENAVVRYKGIPPYKETQDYVKKVTALYKPSDPLQDANLAEAAPVRVNRKIYRVVQADGRILFTNTPTEAVD
ncbi:MAG TPA: lytic transglycosylase domain-containing protein [Acidobacteriota bacterium]|nr:lytic transglycosylase domain-containing protein [Acidobacteriota bacterium]